MRARLFVLVTILITISLLSTPSSTPAHAADNDCNVVNQVCNDMAQMMYNLCILDGNSNTTCAAMEASYKISCKTDNGCPPGGN